MAQVAQLTSAVDGISCHAWSSDGNQLAISPNNNELHIYSGTRNPDSSTWTVTHVLTEHDLLISAVDWSPVHNKIVTCSHDRNAFVWTWQSVASPSGGQAEMKWSPSLTLLRIDRAALDVKWSPDGKKFAVASGAKCVPVCHYEAEHDWWVSKMIKKHKSTVLSVAWHPNSQLLATGGCDFKCRIFSAFIPEVDATQDTAHFTKSAALGEVFAEFGCHGWVHSVAWSPSGNSLAFAGHDSTLHVLTFSSPGVAPVESIVSLSGLSLSVVSFISDRSIIGGGHDCNPALFTATATGGWSFLQWLDQKPSSGDSAAKSSAAGGVAAARALFQSKATRGQESKKEGDELWTKHEAPIISLQPVPSSKASSGYYSTYSTSGMDGRVITWSLPSLNVAMASLGLS